MNRHLFWICILLLGCNENTTQKVIPEAVDKNLDLMRAKNELPTYYNFLSYFVKKGYAFYDFSHWWNCNKDTLPEKYMVIRHDVHHRDIYNSYLTYIIEHVLIGDKCATYYIMLDNPSEMSEKNYSSKRLDYLEIIQFLKRKGVDVQPHISPADMYLEAKHPWWDSLTDNELKPLFDTNYKYITDSQGTSLLFTGYDTLQIKDIENQLAIILRNYNKMWSKSTGLIVNSYCGHGSEAPMHHILSNYHMLDLKALYNADIYKFETENTRVLNFLKVIHDNERPCWMEKPELISDDIYELLVHPYVWNSYEKDRITLNVICE